MALHPRSPSTAALKNPSGQHRKTAGFAKFVSPTYGYSTDTLSPCQTDPDIYSRKTHGTQYCEGLGDRAKWQKLRSGRPSFPRTHIRAVRSAEKTSIGTGRCFGPNSRTQSTSFSHRPPYHTQSVCNQSPRVGRPIHGTDSSGASRGTELQLLKVTSVIYPKQD
jgi:hypothetical protein